MKKLFAIIASVFVFQACSADDNIPKITILLPADYCGEIVVFVYEDEDMVLPSDTILDFYANNLDGDRGVAVGLPSLDQGWRTDFALVDPDKVLTGFGKADHVAISGWYDSNKDVFNILQIDENGKEIMCSRQTELSLDEEIEIAKELEARGELPARRSE